MNHYINVTVRFPKEEYKHLNKLAKSTHASHGDIVRTFYRKYVEHEYNETQKEKADDNT